jgi:hypothetical protein
MSGDSGNINDIDGGGPHRPCPNLIRQTPSRRWPSSARLANDARVQGQTADILKAGQRILNLAALMPGYVFQRTSS